MSILRWWIWSRGRTRVRIIYHNTCKYIINCTIWDTFYIIFNFHKSQLSIINASAEHGSARQLWRHETRARPFHRRATTTVTYCWRRRPSASGLDAASSQGHLHSSCICVYTIILYERRAYTIIIIYTRYRISPFVPVNQSPTTTPSNETTRNSTGPSVLDAVVTAHALLNIIIYAYVTSSEKESRAARAPPLH